MMHERVACFWYDSEKLQRMKNSFYGFFSPLLLRFCAISEIPQILILCKSYVPSSVSVLKNIARLDLSLRFSFGRWFHSKLMKSLSHSVANSSFRFSYITFGLRKLFSSTFFNCSKLRSLEFLSFRVRELHTGLRGHMQS